MRGCVTKKGRRWYWVIYNSTEKKYRWSRGFATREEAELEANKTTTLLMNGGRLPDGKLTVRTYLDQWLEMRRVKAEHAEGYKGLTTWARYEELIRLHVVPAFGTVPVTKLEPLMVDRFYLDKQTEGKISNATIRQIHAVLHKAFKDAFRKGVVTRNVLDLVDRPEIVDRIPQNAPWDFEQAKLFLADTRRTSKWYVMYLFTICTASRVSEIVGLQRPDLDLLLGEVHFRRKMYRLYHKDFGKRIIEGPPKSKHGIRAFR